MLEVQIWQRDQITTPGIPTYVATITTAFDRAWRNAKNDFGHGSLNIPLTDTAAVAAAQPGRLIKFFREGIVRGCIVIGQRNIARVKSGEEQEQVLVIEGDGVMAALNDARVLPYNGAGWSPWDRQRSWDWSNPYLDTSGWVAAVELWRQGDAADLSASTFLEVVRDQGRFAYGPPEGFADADAMWIWSSGYDGTGGTGGSGTLRMDPGTSYFHKTFTVADDTHARVIGACDDFFEFALDGVKLFATAPSPEEAWSRAQQRDVFLTAGTHTIRVKAENYTRAFSNGNIAALIAAVHEVNPVNGSLLSVLVHTDDTWDALDYPVSPPGFTATDIALTLLAEVQAEGFLLDIDPTFTTTTGTSGTMPVLTDITTTVGDPFGEMVKQLAAAWIDTRVNHDMTWDMWEKDVPGSASGVTYTPGVNITELELDGDTTPISSLLVLHQEGYLVLGDASEGRQAFLDLSQLSATEAASRGAEALSDLNNLRWQAIISVNPAGGDVPFDDVDIFDTATVPDPAGTLVATQCIAISYTEDTEGLETLTPEFGDLVLSRDEQLLRDVSRLTVGGRSPLAMPPLQGGATGHSPLSSAGGSFGQVAQTREIDYTRVATDTATTSLAKMVGAGSTISEFAVVFDAPQGGDVDVVLEVNAAPVATITVVAGKVLAQVAGVGFAISKYTDLLTVTCVDVGFGYVATVMVS